MEPITIAAVSTVCANTASVLAQAWTWRRTARRRAPGREAARHQHLRCLPTGSRIVDLGEHGLIIDLGGADRSPDGVR
jgi:hypothetical protein